MEILVWARGRGVDQADCTNADIYLYKNGVEIGELVRDDGGDQDE